MDFSKKNERDMTQGPVWQHIIFFALPLLLGNIFQQLYNTVDNWVVGNWVGKQALAATGSSTPIIFSLIGFFAGLATGAGVIISQYYGAKNDKKVSETVQTTIVMILFLSIVISLAGVLLTPLMLKAMNTPENVLKEGETYLRIYFAGASGLLLYNAGSGILRAVGDSRRPLYFLIFTAILNTVLDLVFVIVFKWGIAGAAYATIISQGLSAILVLITLTRTKASYRILWKKLSFSPFIFRQILAVGLPAAIQQLLTAVSNVFVQAYINNFGEDVMAGWSAYRNIDMFMLLPMMSVSLAGTTFTGQNTGAGNLKRVKEGVRTTLALAEMITVALLIFLFIFASNLVHLFSKDQAVISQGTMLLRLLSPFYIACVVNQIFAGILRGAGDARAPMFIMLASFVLFRQLYLAIVSRLSSSLIPIALGYPAGWVACSIGMFVYYKAGRWKKLMFNNSYSS